MSVSDLLNWFSWRGRLRRRLYWLEVLLSALIFSLLYISLNEVFGRPITLILNLPMLAFLLAASVRRLHDQAKSAAWLLWLLLPVLGPILLVLLLLFKRGTEGSNQYGDDPRTIGRDYLKVRIDAK
jgi:uncharacterized membrane protein YhaH (DUF805 family)